MASNPYVNKVQLADGQTLMDLSGDTVAANKMLSGITAHDKSGAPVTGNIPTKTASDMTVSGKTVTAPAGYYASSQSKNVADGSTTQNAPTVDSSGLVKATSTVTAGYQSAGTKSSTLQLPTQAGKTVTPTRSEQTVVDSGKYTTGPVKVGPIPASYYTMTEAAAILFPVGSFYASENGNDNPATILGVGTWRKISPANTVNELKNQSGVDDFVTVGTLYVWKRTA